MLTKQTFCSSAEGVPRQKFLKPRVNYTAQPSLLTPLTPAHRPSALHHDADGMCQAHRRSWETAEDCRMLISEACSFGRYTHIITKSPAHCSGFAIPITKGLCFISRVKNLKSLIQLCVRFKTLHLIFCTRELVFCIFRLANSCLHTKEYFLPRETIPGTKRKIGTKICAAPLSLPTGVYLASGLGGQEGKARGRWKSLNWSHQGESV